LTANNRNLAKEGLVSGQPGLEHAVPVAGFLVRPDAPHHGNYPGSFIWSGKFLVEPGKADAVVEALKENLPYIESSEPDTISFLVFKGLDNPDAVYVWERYKSESALRDVHQKSAGYARLRETIGPLMKTRTINGYREVAGFLTKQGGIL
jgi:quinol monooxygenase YgiN